MKKIIAAFFLLLPLFLFSQTGINLGIKAGLNFANVTNASSINAENRTGYLLGGFIATKSKKLLGFRSELILSRQGYDYKTNTNTGTVNLDYLLLPQLLTIRFSKFIQLQAGVQAAFLLSAKVDSASGNGNGSLFDYFNRFDYGFVAGGEVSPISGFFVGARLNTSFKKVTQDAPSGGSWPNFIPRLDAKNNVVQIYAGWRF